MSKQISGTWLYSSNLPVASGILYLTLSQDATIVGTGQVAPSVYAIPLNTLGEIPAATTILANDELSPSGTVYQATVIAPGGGRVWGEALLAIAGTSPIDINSLIPLLNTSGIVVYGSVSGDLSVDSINTPQSNTTPVQIGSVWYPGTATGTATAPTGTPGSSVTLSGGSIADGTYYAKVTYFNRNGETTGSPTKTITVSGGGGAAKIYVASNDNDWATGTYGYLIYCSNDNVTFYLQTPTAVANDFLLTDANGGAPTGKTGHYVKLGSTGARFTSLTFSGTTIPTSNTATISPQQVALNATRRASDYNPQGTLLLGALDAAGANGHSITTPLIMLKGDDMGGVGAQSGLVNIQTRLVSSTNWNATQLAVVMAFGGDAHISNMGIQGQNTNALMILGGAGYQAGNIGGMSVSDVALRTTGSASAYRAIVMTGIIYHTFWNNVSVGATGNYVLEWRNAAGQNHTFTGGRWDTSGAGIVRSIPSWTDPDNGAHDAAFPFGVANIRLTDILTEGGTGILYDCVGLSMFFDNVQNADAAILAGTDSIAKFGTDATYGGATNISLYNTSFGTSSNTRVGTNFVGVSQTLFAYGNSLFGFGSSTGSQQTVDFNSIQGMTVYDFAGAIGSLDASAATTTPHAINLHDNTVVRAAFGDRGGGVNVQPQNEIFGLLGFTYKTGSTATRSTIKYIGNVAGGFNILGSDRATSQFGLNPTIIGANDSFATFRGNARVNAASANASTLFIGPSASTAASGTIASVGGTNFQVKGGSTDVTLFSHSTSAGEHFNICVTNCTDTKTAFPIVSTLATGTAPLTIASTTKVTNLNADLLDDKDSATAGTATTIAARDASGRLTAKRFIADGTALVDTDFVVAAGWGDGPATIGTITGSDQAWQGTITATGANQTLNPELTLTFKDGTWTNAPICMSKMNGGTGAITDLVDAPTATTNVITFRGTPVTTLTYIITSICIGRP